MNSGQTPTHVAFHEAGHFVAQMHLQPTSYRAWISIIPNEDDGILGSVLCEDVDMCENHMPSLAIVDGEILCLLAGHAAECKFDPSDYYAETAKAGACSDFEKALIYCQHVNKTLEDFHPEVNRFVCDHWVEIESLANALLIEKKLSGEEAEFWLEYSVHGDHPGQLALENYPALKRLVDLVKSKAET